MKDTDYGHKQLMVQIRKLAKGTSISVGIHAKEGEADYDKDQSVLEVGTFNEFGLGVPERSFIRAWFDENEKKAKTAIQKLMERAISGDITKEQAFELLGQSFVGGIQQRIANGIPPENADSTIKKKGSSKPLIDTSQLRNSITYMVQDDDDQSSG